MAKKILQSEHKVLRDIATEVSVADITTPAIKKVLKEMSASLKSQNDGVAIAAPQIGYSLRIFVVAGKIFSPEFADENRDTKDVVNAQDIKDLVFINPVITKLSKEKEWVPEGCLSVRPLYGKTHRSKKATVTAYDEHGNKFTRGGAGLLAQIFQHEIDHLNGILFIDHAKDVKAEELPE
ncbi:MAG: peptide deformylase [Candidatus Paceibacterota bacterium]